MNRKGFTLVELIVVMAIIGILSSIVTLNFGNWMRKTQIERQTRELFTDLNTARTESIYRKKRHRFTFEPTNYAFKRYTSADEDSSAGTTVNSRNVSYQLALENGENISGKSLLFDTRGLLSGASTLTLRVNPVDSGASLDCIIIHFARTNMGKMENGSCVFK